MGSQRSLLRNISDGVAGRRHTCKSNSKHVLLKGDPILIVKIERTNYHYCVPCARKFIAAARAQLADLETALQLTESTESTNGTARDQPTT